MVLKQFWSYIWIFIPLRSHETSYEFLFFQIFKICRSISGVTTRLSWLWPSLWCGHYLPPPPFHSDSDRINVSEEFVFKGQSYNLQMEPVYCSWEGGRPQACQIQLGSFGHLKGSTKNIMTVLNSNSKESRPHCVMLTSSNRGRSYNLEIEPAYCPWELSSAGIKMQKIFCKK